MGLLKDKGFEDAGWVWDEKAGGWTDPIGWEQAHPGVTPPKTSEEEAPKSALSKGEFGPDEQALAETLRLNRQSVLSGGTGLDSRQMEGMMSGIYKEAATRQQTQQYIDISREELKVKREQIAAGKDIAEEESDASMFGAIGSVVGSGIGAYGKVASAGMSIICTELTRMGYIRPRLHNLERKWIQKNIPTEAYEGYLLVAKPIVELMRHSKLLVLALVPFARAFVGECAHRTYPNVYRGSWLGARMIQIGIPLFKMIWRIKNGK